MRTTLPLTMFSIGAIFRIIMPINRRDFLWTAALAGTALDLAAQSTPEPAPWFDRPMRWAQLTLVEDDPGKYNPAFWLDYFKRTHSDAACLSAGGTWPITPPKSPLHYRSKWLGQTDAFGELVAGCRQLNMNVIARTDPHAALQDVVRRPPRLDRRRRLRKEAPKNTIPSCPNCGPPCALGPYNIEFMT